VGDADDAPLYGWNQMRLMMWIQLGISILCAASASVYAEQPTSLNAGAASEATKLHRATDSATPALALVIGSNRAGPGQTPLRFAHEDARRFARVLSELGGISRANIQLVYDPDQTTLRAQLMLLHQRLAKLSVSGKKPAVVFFYSGHSRARALELGKSELALTELRGLLTALPAQATVAIFDACQTGAISNIKGVRPAKRFSFNSVSDLNTSGLVVMASSTASELSQESSKLRGSYFTHHLVAGLRGAADRDSDGRVTLSEAYAYAYNRTLVSTASTAVGRQHVTLETRLRGKGEMVLTYPSRAIAKLVLPKTLAGDFLVHRGRQVMAELHKVPGKVTRLALPAGRYEAIRRGKKKVRRCPFRLVASRTHVLDIHASACREKRLVPTAPKGRDRFFLRHPRALLEIGIGGSFYREDDYVKALGRFGYDRDRGLLEITNFSMQVKAGVRFHQNLELLLGWKSLDYRTYDRGLSEQGSSDVYHQTVKWNSHAIDLTVRGAAALFSGHIRPYAQASVGLGFAISTFADTHPNRNPEDGGGCDRR
jgi:hypothetical protein